MQSDQLDLFGDGDPAPGRKAKLGHANIEYKDSGSILTPTSGFMDTYDFSINPYSGCSFGCTYCYAAFFSRDAKKMANWGKWVQTKQNALALLAKKKAGSLNGKTVYMSSVTDPYQPIDRELELTRGLLEILWNRHPEVRLVIQTRSPMVTRDIDLLSKFSAVQVNMTVTTDDEEVRKVFEPYCPSNVVRLKGIQEVREAGIRACITMTPLLPVSDPEGFARNMKETGVEHYIIQPFHRAKGKFVAGTRDQAMALLDRFNWGDEEYQRVLAMFQQVIPEIGVGKAGFAPPV